VRTGRIGPPPGASARPPGDTAVRDTWSLEVQIHPGDIRKRVRYLFLSRTHVAFWAVAGLLYLLGLLLAGGVAPTVVQGYASGHEYQSLVNERFRQGERLQDLLGRLDRLEARAQALQLGMEKVALAYGLPPPKPVNPARPAVDRAAPPVPDSIYAGTIDQGHRRRDRLGVRLSALAEFLGRVGEFERSHPDQVRTTPATCPLRADFVLTSPFGRRRNPFTQELELHAGIDLAAPLGSFIRATADGVVVFAGRYPLHRDPAWWRLGNLVAVESGEDFVTLFGHCQDIAVRKGQQVRRGDLLATVGRSEMGGSTQLHYEVRHRDAGELRPHDPLVYILDHRWPNEERVITRARSGAAPAGFAPLPPGIAK
jgi:murein DD-endopeptidase MepM/ murein hydrolase activator NlpD